MIDSPIRTFNYLWTFYKEIKKNVTGSHNSGIVEVVEINGHREKFTSFSSYFLITQQQSWKAQYWWPVLSMQYFYNLLATGRQRFIGDRHEMLEFLPVYWSEKQTKWEGVHKTRKCVTSFVTVPLKSGVYCTVYLVWRTRKMRFFYEVMKVPMGPLLYYKLKAFFL